LRLDGKAAGVLLCERKEAPFTEAEVQQFRLLCDQGVRRLSDLHEGDRWFGARWAGGLRDYFGGWAGPEHTWSKVAAIFGAAVLAALVFVRVDYRVEGNFILRSDATEFLTAPFDGYIEQVYVRAGDHVAPGGKLVALNRSELLLEEAAALAEMTRCQRESDKARAAKNLAEMRIADAQAQEAQARLDLVRYRLDNAIIKSAFDGIVVEGDLRERIAAPVKQGDALFKIARLDALYAEAEIPERDVAEVLGKSNGEIAFVARPKLKYPVTIDTIEPAAAPKKDGNVFFARLKFDHAPETWWRPGMTGLCKLSTGKRSLMWILTHRTVDFLRMKLWW
jgi:multidrug efflux pump subunit AcrA (membrane-fusion protein)